MSKNARERVADVNSSSIDWSHEYAKERIRLHALSEVKGIRGILIRLWSSAIPWIVVVLIGIGTGTLAASLDILSSWLSDLRLGSCRDMWWMSKGVCCAGLDRTCPFEPLHPRFKN
jgi:chloride channel 3/4/5